MKEGGGHPEVTQGSEGGVGWGGGSSKPDDSASFHPHLYLTGG